MTWNILLLVTLMVIIIFVVFAPRRYFEERVDPRAKEILSQLSTRYPDVFSEIEEYKIYTTGHPYVWVEVTYQGFIDSLGRCSKHSGGEVTRFRTAYTFKVDVDNKTAYLAIAEEIYDFSRLMHYQDWLNSMADVKRNISNKNGQD